MSNWRERVNDKIKQKQDEKKKENEKSEENSYSVSNTRNWRNSVTQKVAAKGINFSTFSDDLNAMNTTIRDVYGGWQSRETMDNTRSSVEGMYNRLLSYEDYRIKFGSDDWTDLSELTNTYKSALDNWEDKSKEYSNYESADAYNEAVKLLEKMKTDDLEAVQTDVDTLGHHLEEARKLKKELDKLESRKSTAQYSNNMGFDTSGYEHQLYRAWCEYNEYLKNIGYSSVDDLEKAVGEKTIYLTQATRIQNNIALSSVSDPESEKYDTAFDKYVNLGYEIPYTEFGSEISSWSSGSQYTGWDETEPDKYRKAAMALYLHNGGDSVNIPEEYRNTKYTGMTKQQFDTFAYWLAKDEEDGGNHAYQYIDYIDEQLEIQKGIDIAKSIEDKPVLQYLYAIPAGLDQFGQGLINVFNFNDDYIPLSATQVASGMVRSDIKYKHGVIGQGAYDLINTTSNMLPSILASTVTSLVATPTAGAAVGATLMGVSAAGNAYQEMLNLGYSKGQARVYSTLTGVAEAGLSYAFSGISKLGGKVTGTALKAVDKVDNGLARFAIRYGGNMLSEGFEEAAQEILNPIFTNIAAGYDTGAEVDWDEVVYSGLLGALSSGFLEGGSIARNTYRESAFNNRMGQNIRDTGRIGDLLNIAAITPQKSQAYQTYAYYTNKKGVTAENISNYQLGNLYSKIKESAYDTLNDNNSTKAQQDQARQMLSDLEAYGQSKSVSKLGKGNIKEIYGDAESINALISEGIELGEGTEAYELAMEYKKKLESGKKLTTAEITKLVDANSAEVMRQDRAEIAEELTELGEKGDISKLAEIIARKNAGEKLTSDEVKMLQQSDYGKKVINEGNVELMEASETLSDGSPELFIETYEGGDVEQYKKDFQDVAFLANNNYDADYILKNRGTLTPRQVQNIYNKVITEPRAQQQRALDELVKKYEGKLVRKANIDDSIFNGAKGQKLWRNLTKRQKMAITFVKAFAKGAGINLKITYNGKYKGKSYNGYYDHATNTIVIDARAGFDKKYVGEDAIVTTMSHELTHWMKKKSPELYAELSKKIFGVLEEATGKTEYDLISKELLKHPEMTDDQARDEIIARACEDLLKMSEEGRKIFNSLSESEQKTLKAKIKEIIQNLIDWVNELLGQYDSKSREAEWLRGVDGALQDILETWDKMLANSVDVNAALEAEGSNAEAWAKAEKNTAETDGVRMSEKTFDKQVDDVLNGADTVSTHLRIAKHTPKILLDLGLNDKPMLITSVHTKTALGYKIREKNTHNVSVDVFKMLPQLIEKPAMIMESVKQGSIVMFVNAVDANNNPIVCSIKIDGRGFFNNVEIESNVVTSVYGKDTNPIGFIKNAVDDNRLLYWDKKMSQKLFAIPGLQLPDNIKNFDSNVIIRKITEKNNKQNVNNEGVQFSEKDYSYESIIKKPDMTLTVVGDDVPNNRADIVHQAIKNAKSVGYTNENGNAVVRVDDIKTDVIVPKKSIVHGLDRRMSSQAPVMVKIGEVLKNAIRINELVPRSENAKNTYVLIGSAVNKSNELYIASFVVNRFTNEIAEIDVLYSANAKKESAALLPKITDRSATPTDPVISIANLLEFVNRYFPDILPESVLRHYGHTERPDGTLGESVLFSEKDNDIDNYSYDNLSASDYYENGKIYSYNFLVAQKNMVTVQLPKTGTLTNEKGKIDDNKVIDFGIKNTLSVGTKRGNKVYVENDYTKRELRIDNSTIKHGLDGTYNRHLTNARIGSVIGNIVKNAIPVNGLKNSSDIAVGTYAMASYCYDDQGREFIAIVTVEQQSGNVEGVETYDVAHAVSGRQKKSSQVDTKSQGVYPIKATDISISHLIEIVNSTHQSILSDDVLEHLGEKRNPKGSYSDKVLFSEKDNGISAYDIMGEYKALEKRYNKLKIDFDNLKELLKIEKSLTNGKIMQKSQLEAAARFLVKYGESNYNVFELARILNELYVELQDGAMDDSMTWDEMYAKAYEVAKIIRSEARVKIERPALYDRILKDIRSARIAPNSEQKGDAKHRFGDHYIGKFRGRVTIANDGTPLDEKWSEWSAKYPSVFDKDISPAQQLVELYDIYDDLRNAGDVVKDYEESEMLHYLATEIINKAWTVAKFESTADKYEKRIKELNAEHRKAMDELRETYKDKVSDAKLLEQMYYGKKLLEKDKKIADQRLADDMHYGKLLHDLRIKRVKEVAEAKQLGRERLAQYRENSERKSVIQSITNVSLALNKKLTTNSKDVHIPEDLKPVVINLLNAIDFSSKRMLNKEEPTKKDFAIDNSLSKVHSMDSGTVPTVSLKQSIEDALDLFVNANNVLNSVSKKTVDDSIVSLNVDMIEEIEKMLENFNQLMEQGKPIFVLQEMSTENLKTLSKMVRSIRHWASVADQTLGNKHKRRISELSLQTIDENSFLKERQEYVEKIEGVKDFFNWSNLLPVNAFHRLGDAATELFDELRDAQDKLTFNRQLVIDFMGDLIDKYKKQKINIKDWRTDVKTFDVQLPGEKNTTRVRMPVSFIMSLYCTEKQEDARRHLYGKDASGNKLTYKDKDGNEYDGGGITIKGYKEGKFKLKVNKNLDNTILNESIVKQITGVLTKEQIEVADAMQEFMDVTGAEWGNAVSMALYGIKKFGIKNYFPISVSPHTLSADMVRDDKASLFSILNYGLTKERNPNANQSIEIGDIFEVFANHMNMVAIYNAYALSIYDIVRWYNFKGKKENGKEVSVTASIEKAFGKGAITYVNNLIKDLNGQHASSRLGFLGQILKNEKVAMVGYSLSVSLIQPVAYFKAMTRISPKYLLKAAMYVKDFGVKKGVEKSKKYCGIALLKSQGYFETGISTSTTTKMLHDESLHEKAIEWSLKFAEFMDERTWGVLWNACEFEVRATRKDLKVGSEEFYRVVGEKLRDVIYETQVVDSPLTKSDLMRSPDTGAKMITMFATELTVAYNMVYEAVYQANLYSKNPQKAENDFIKAHEDEYIKKYGDNYMERLERDAKEVGIKEADKKNRKNILMNLTAYALTSTASGILYTAVQNSRKGFRDDDDEDKELEDYIKEAWLNVLLELHPLSKIPYFKEILSIKEGYSPSMPGFSWLVSAFKAYKAFVKASEGKEGQTLKGIEEMMKSFSYVSGLPIYNPWRELKGTLKTIGIME